MSDQFQPPRAAIDKVLKKYTPEQIAIAYLRASRRARAAETAFSVMDKVAGATIDAMGGDLKGASDKIQRATRTLKRKHE